MAGKEKKWKDMSQDERDAAVERTAKVILDDKNHSRLAFYRSIEDSGAYGDLGSQSVFKYLYQKEVEDGEYAGVFSKMLKASRNPRQRYSGRIDEQEMLERASATYERALLFTGAEKLLEEIGYEGKELMSRVKGKRLKDLDEREQGLVLNAYMQHKSNEIVREALEASNSEQGKTLDEQLLAMEKAEKLKQEQKSKVKNIINETKPEDLQLAA